MLNFCTLFDSNFLYIGLAMYESLLKNCKSFHLYIFAFDDKCFETLNKLNLSCVTVISMKDFESEELLNVKSSRTVVEYFWTCTSSTILYVLEKYNVDHCTYLDADTYFFADPKVLVEEMENKSVLITEHRYTPKYDASKTSGTFCVQFVTFKKNLEGLKVLRHWKDCCINWCYNRIEDGKFGDQKYLDNWPDQFSCIHILKNIGGGVAPWNIQQYEFFENKDYLAGKEIQTGKEFKVIFYHFHDVKCNFEKGLYQIIFYKINNQHNELIYDPYFEHLKAISIKLNEFDNLFSIIGEIKKEKALKPFVFRAINKIKSMLKLGGN
ncbi:MAG: glycosyl transferase [Cyanobacteriota bacterium]